MYENIFTLTSPDAVNVTLYALPGASVGIGAPTDDNGDGIWNSVEQNVNQNTKIVLTGRFFQSAKGNICYQMTLNGQLGYIWDTELNTWSTTQNSSTGDAQNFLNELISYDQAILENNLLCARIFNYCKTNGIALPTDAHSQLYNLQSRLTVRDQKIIESGYVDVNTVQTGSSPNFSVYNQHLIDFMNNPGVGKIGVIPIIVYVVVSAIVLAATSYIAINVYKSMHAEAKADFNYSNDLTAQLVKFLPTETYKQLMAENAANAQKAQDAINAASGGGLMNTLKYAAIGLGVFWVFDRFIAK
jgi:hypothetical protein